MTKADADSPSRIPLATWLAQQTSFDLRGGLALIRQLAEQVLSLHGNGRIHRAIDGDSVTVDLEGRPYLSAPGEPRPFGGDRSDPEFCPPELVGGRGVTLPQQLDEAVQEIQKAGYDVDPRRIDVYQLGVLLFRWMIGESIATYVYDPKIKNRVSSALRAVLEPALGLDGPKRLADCGLWIAAIDQSLRQLDGPKTDAFPGPNGDPKLPFERLGHFRILERIGGGGMGDVYRADDESLGRSVAIKVLPAPLARDAEFVRRFHAEAAAAASVAHPNIVPIHFIGEDAGHHYFAMQLIEGESLAQRLNRQGRFSCDEALDCIVQCLQGLQAAHHRGLIHRDIKPGNILIERETGRAMLVDFGLVRRLDDNARNTATGVIMGTVDYIAPEQARGRAVDARTDLYSLGVLFYQLLAGHLPFTADSPTSMIFQHAYEPPFPLEKSVPNVPRPIVDIVARMMAKDPNERYPDCAAVLADIAAYRKGCPLASFSTEAAGPSDTASEPSPVFQENSLRQARDWAATMFRRVAPQWVQNLQGTTLQMDAAVAQHQRQRDRLAKLLEEARSLKNHLLPEELEDLQRQFDAADAKLIQLRSQQQLLKARLQSAEVQRQLEGGPPASHHRRFRWSVVMLVMAGGVGLLIFALLLLLIGWRPVPTSLAGGWVLTLPSQTQHHATISNAGEGRYLLRTGGNMTGVYQLRGDKLAMLEPQDQRLTEFVWQVENPNQMVLIESPPIGKTGAEYRGAMLKRTSMSDAVPQPKPNVAMGNLAMSDNFRKSLNRAIEKKGANAAVYVIGNSPNHQIMTQIASGLGLRVGSSFNWKYDKYLPQAKGHILLIETHGGKPIVSKNILEAYFPKATAGLSLPLRSIQIDDTFIIFVEFDEPLSIGKTGGNGSPTNAAFKGIAFRCEADASTAVSLQLKTPSHNKTVRTWKIQTPATFTLNPSELTTDNYKLFVSADGYASQVISLRVSKTAVKASSENVTLYRKRYVVVRYARNRDGSRDLSPAKTQQDRLAVSHWGQIPGLRGDWQIWQKGPDLYFELHRYGASFGFVEAPAGAIFDKLRWAPENDQYVSASVLARPGQILFTRIAGNNPTEQCYAKMEVEAITDQPPEGVEFIESSR
ncbi:MAG: protein kinase [Thermoguttaceae bacterium]